MLSYVVISEVDIHTSHSFFVALKKQCWCAMSRQVLLRLYFVPWSYLSDFPSLLSAQLHLNMRFMSFKLPQIHSKAQPMCVCVCG